jgi:predicted acylesterase/phospholipase RssA/CRP-like cAMP-binding protein
MSDAGALEDAEIDELLQRSPVFGRLAAAPRELIRKEFSLRFVHRGDVVIEQGDTADGLYLVGNGRLRVSITKGDGQQTILDEVARGELVGEMALLNERPRSATVVALRDSHLLFLSTEAFARLVDQYPDALRAVSTALIDKLVNTIHHGSYTSRARVIAIVPLDESTEAREFGFRLKSALEPLVRSVRTVEEGDFRRDVDDPLSYIARANWREELEGTCDVVINVATNVFDEWTDDCTQSSDLLLLVTSARGSRGLRAVEDEIVRHQRNIPTRTELVLLHDASTAAPRRTSEWLTPRAVQRHHHVRVDRTDDYARVARLITNQGIAVVFSGGGARGIAHIGVLRALRDARVPIDATAGASIGSIVAGAVARGDSPEELAAQLRAAVVQKSPVDVTFPTMSFASGGRVTRLIKDGAANLDLEDLWLNFTCVSTNLTRGRLQVHERGPAWSAVRASFAVPGLFPPMRSEAGDVLVDGGMLDNLPVGPLRHKHAGVTIIASDVGAQRELLSISAPNSGVVSGWRTLARSLRERSTSDLTTLPRVLMRLTELGASGDVDHGDCYIRPALDGVSLLDFNRFDFLVEQGEQAGREALDAWQQQGDTIDLRG